MKIADRSYKLEAWLTACLWVIYFLFIENGAESKYLGKMLIGLVGVTVFLFTVYVKRKRKQENPAYKDDLLMCLIGWTVYLLVYAIYPDLKLVDYALVALCVYSTYVALIYLGKLMLKIGGDDLY